MLLTKSVLCEGVNNFVIYQILILVASNFFHLTVASLNSLKWLNAFIEKMFEMLSSLYVTILVKLE